MRSQWDCIRENVGIWHGSFTQFSAEGEQVKDVPSVLTLAEVEPGKKMQLTLERTPPGESTSKTRRDFSAPGPAPYVYFFEDGSFSQGSSQWAAFSQFGVEMSIKVGDRRARFVIMYEGTSEGTSRIKYVTLIRETQAEGSQFEALALSVDRLLGKWTGGAKVLHADMSDRSEGESRWQLEDSALMSQETFDETTLALALTSETGLKTGERNLVLQGNLTYQLMPLPNGTYCLVPQTICKGQAFRVEVGWLRDGERSRLIRYYDRQGVWTHTALVEDRLTD